jgi:uncharacterized YccA/Bax inhibitor family protein
MTVQGTVGKTSLLLAILTATAIWSWNYSVEHGFSRGILIGSAIGAFIVALITIARPHVAPYSAPLYAGIQGVLLGVISRAAEMVHYKGVEFQNGIVMQAASLTFATLLLMLVLYGTRIIRVTQKLAAGIVMATGAVALVYLISLVVNLFGGEFPYIWSSGPIGIGFSLFVVGLASFNLLLDFDFIERGARTEAPKYMEWYGAFGLMVTLIWLYLEILRLLSKLANRRD